MKNPSRRGRPINEDRHHEIIEIAGQMFGEHGFHTTKMEHIAKALKISKLTLYSRFKDKEELFSAVIKAKCQEYIPDDMFVGLDKYGVKDSLFYIASSLMQLLTSDAAMGMERMLMGVDPKERPKLTKLFYQAGPWRVKTLIAEHLSKLHAEKKLRITDPVLSTNVFAAMIKGSDICMRAHMDITPKPTEKEKRDYCKKIVSFFVKAHPLF